MDNQKYFTEYEDLDIHELMLKDKPRQDAYYNAIMSNKSLFENKIVLDVGAGTGILSLFCAKAGAKLVYAVEATNLAKLATEIINENNLRHIIKVFQMKIENFKLPSLPPSFGISDSGSNPTELELTNNHEKVDIIVSEWMGFYLLHEGMLDSIIFARDNFLKNDGLMFPNSAALYIAPCQIPSLHEYWECVNDVKMTKFAEKLRIKKSNKPEIMCINSNDLLHEGITMSWLDLNEVTLNDIQEICVKEVLTIQKDGKHQGFCIWFICYFPNSDENTEKQNNIVLSTSPSDPPTHWKQCVIILPDNACDDVTKDEPIAFQIRIKRNPNDIRKYNIEVELLDPKDVEHPLPCDCHMTKCILAKTHLQNFTNDSNNTGEMNNS